MNLRYIETSGKNIGKIPHIVFAKSRTTDKQYTPKITDEKVEIVNQVKIGELDMLQSSGVWNTKIPIDITPSYISDELYDFRKEQQAFYSMREQLKKEYPDKYVAIHGGRVVDCDISESALIERFYNKFGNVAVYIDKPEEKRVIKIRSPRRIH